MLSSTLGKKQISSRCSARKSAPGSPIKNDRKISFHKHFKHLVKFAERLPNGKYRWRFASHPRFRYWALDMKQRHKLLSQSNVYLHQHPADANMTIEELREMVNSMSGRQMVNWLQRYVYVKSERN